MSQKLLCFTLFLLFTTSLCKRDPINFVYEVSAFLNPGVQPLTDLNPKLVEFTEGFLIGVGSASNFDDLKACLVDSEDIYNEIDTGVQDIMTKKGAKIKQGIALLGKAAEAVPEAAQTCELADADIEKLIQAVETFKNPVDFVYYVGKSLLINHVEVINEVENIVDAYQNQNYTAIGYWIGKTMDTILLKQEKALERLMDTKTDVLDFTKGFLEGVGSSSIFDNITACLNDTDQFATEVDQGVADIETKKPEEVKKGIALLGQAAQLVPNAVQLCKVADANLDALIKEVESFKNPKAFFYYVDKSLIINHVEVFHEVDNAVKGYEAQNYTDVGYWIGKAMDTIFINQNDTLQNAAEERFRARFRNW